MSNLSRIPGPRPTVPVVQLNGALPGLTRKVQPEGRDPATALRLDALDARIWAAARTLDDPQLAVATARDLAREVFVALVLRAGDGRHRINCSVAAPEGAVSAPTDLPVTVLADLPAVSLPGGGADEEIRELMALAHVTGWPAVLILRTFHKPAAADTGRSDGTAPDGVDGLPPEDRLPDQDPHDYTVRGWRVTPAGAEPIDAAGMFAFCCSEASSGEPLPINPGTRYADAPALSADRPTPEG